MVTLYEGAFAKLNLTLDVLDKRADGYHNLKSVMQTVSIRDDIEIDLDTGKPWTLSCTDDQIPADNRNLAWKAAEVFFEATKKDPNGLAIRITKRIPCGAGLGGGSADAAAVLRALNKHYDNPFSIFALAELGASVGSDVPFCTICGTAMVEGRGERVRKLPDMPDCVFVICKPEFSISTPELYQKLDASTIAKRPDNTAMESALLAGDLGKVAENLCNVFDPVVTADHLELNYIKSIFNTYGSVGQQMTGSGSAVFAIVPDFEFAAVICNMLKENYPQVYIAKPV
ncbi:MAG: 4-(cytidine 5'-diphospho)-2-C-methyl-D-erythritol kinase [Oscillospiraceae bacterium]|nr:4-(cytidine 5'-diphospho)-2-C-methyl-D-erythritol kinase [Oscillospiraceae bacterium]